MWLAISFSIVMMVLQLWSPFDFFEVDLNIPIKIITAVLSGLIYASVFYWLDKLTLKDKSVKNDEK